MKLTVQTKLLPDVETSNVLLQTMERFNEAASWLATFAFERKTASKFALQKLYYYDIRERFELSAQMTIRCIAQVCEAYKRDKKKLPTFRPRASIPYDQRLYSFKGPDRVSLLTLEGRRVIPFVMGEYQRAKMKGRLPRQADLVYRKGQWFFLVTVELPEPIIDDAEDFLGVDFGVVNIAVDSDGETFSGAVVEQVRQRHYKRRKQLQKAASAKKKRGERPRSIYRAQKRRDKSEQNFRRDFNHQTSKQLVVKAKDTKRGIALENLKGIRSRTRFRKAQRARMSGWAFFQLRTFIEYKSALAGIPVVSVNPRNTSVECSKCGHIEKANRSSQGSFRCLRCGYAANADFNAARNIRARAVVNQPMVSGSIYRSQEQAPSFRAV